MLWVGKTVLEESLRY